MSLQELQEAAYFDMLKCLVYTGSYNFDAKLLLTKLRKQMGVPMEQHSEWHRNLEVAQKNQTFDYNRIPTVAAFDVGAPLVAPEGLVARNPSMAASTLTLHTLPGAATPAPAPVPVVPPPPLVAAAVAAPPPTAAPPAPSLPAAAAPAKASAGPMVRTTSLAQHYQADTPPPPPAAKGGGPSPHPLGDLGRKVKRLWDSQWVAGIVTDYSADTGQHVITYDLGSKNETFEDVKLCDLDPTVLEYTDVRIDLLAQYPTSRAVKNSVALKGAARSGAGGAPASTKKGGKGGSGGGGSGGGSKKSGKASAASSGMDTDEEEEEEDDDMDE